MKKITIVKEKALANVAKYNKKDKLISLFRLLSFFTSIILFCGYSIYKINLYLFLAIICFFLFIILLYYSSRLINLLNFNKNILLVCDEIENGNHNSLDIEMPSTPNHPYCNDLDILGKNSLISSINITQTYYGKQTLREFLLNVSTNNEIIKEKQNAIKEFSKDIEWCIFFLAKAKDTNKDTSISAKYNFFSNSEKIKFLATIISTINIFIIVLFSILDITYFSILLLLIPLTSYLIIKWAYGKKIKKQYFNANLKATEIAIFSNLFNEIEQKKFSSKKNNLLKEQLTNDLNAQKSINKLSKLLNYYENKKIPIIGILLNIILLWDLHYAIKIENHIKKIKINFPLWLNTIGEIEALISFGIFAYKNSEFVYPELTNDKNKYCFENLSHPLLNKNIRIYNNFKVDNGSNISIITGANMTGKSTFLRSVGVNLVLAMNGCPVCADKFVFYPISIFSSMRTSDSLSEGSSYFNAEIERLKELIEKLSNNEPQFIILDEILKGTNSVDKLNGSKLFIKKLLSYNIKLTCIIATHDIELTKMSESYPENINNYCFELNNLNGKLISDYKLNKGVTKTMNALFLMKENGIIE